MDAASRAAWPVTFAIIAAIAASAVAPAWVNHDAGWYLHMAGVWLDGGELYHDVIDTNPPLIVALTAVPVAIGRALHQPIPGVFKTVVFCAAAASSLLAALLIGRVYTSVLARLLVSATTLFLLLPFVGSDFGQREHLAAILSIPYVLATAAWAAGRPLPRRLDLIVGVIAGLGIALKPHFLLAWASIEASALLPGTASRSWRRGSVAGVVGVLVLYAVSTLILTPQYFSLAREVASVYGGLDAPPGVLSNLSEIRLWFVAALVLAVLTRTPGQWRPSAVVFAAFTGFLLAALVQLKAWGYHLYPARVFGYLFFTMVFAALLDAAHPVARVFRWARAATVAAMLLALVLVSWRHRSEVRAAHTTGPVKALDRIVRDERVESMGMLGMRTLIFPAFPVVNHTGARWVMRHHSLWFLPGLYSEELAASTGEVPHRSLGGMPPLERKYFEQIIADLCADPPGLLLVEPPPRAVRRGAGSLDLVAYYSQDPRFARLFGGYDLFDTVEPFNVYLRQAGAACGHQ